jgi:hydroxymethylpyrimidine/phosphomethylpyrimidine kinase
MSGFLLDPGEYSSSVLRRFHSCFGWTGTWLKVTLLSCLFSITFGSMDVSPPVVLSIAGFDPGSGAGISADLKTIAAHGCYGVAAITALTVQNTQEVRAVEPVSGRLLRATLEALAGDLEIQAVRIGMLGTAEVAHVVGDYLEAHPPKFVVLDPIIQSSSGAVLLGESGIEVLQDRLVRLATVVTPNTAEAGVLAGIPVESPAGMKRAAEELQKLGAKNVVVTGGHLPGNTDFLRLESGEVHQVTGEKVESTCTHGTGCAYATAIACNLATGKSVLDACTAAKRYVAEAIRAAYPIGHGRGPMNHLYQRG